tara:strand:+ start:442 stop:846 length:405 start_codon:yes stop_codon:yes gene_type:complete
MKARIINNVAVDVCSNPEGRFPKEFADTFVAVPDDVINGWVIDDKGTWTAPVDRTPPVVENPKPVTKDMVDEFMTSAERIATRNSTDDYVVDFREMLAGPGYLVGSQAFDDAVDKVVAASVLTAERGTELKALY